LSLTHTHPYTATDSQTLPVRKGSPAPAGRLRPSSPHIRPVLYTLLSRPPPSPHTHTHTHTHTHFLLLAWNLSMTGYFLFYFHSLHILRFYDFVLSHVVRCE